MTEKELYDFLSDLHLTGHEDDCFVAGLLRERNVSRKKVKVHGGATKVCLDFVEESFVIKWAEKCCYKEFDEAMAEVGIYQEAVAQGIEMFFPKTELFATINGISFVKQEKIDNDCGSLCYQTELKYSERSKTASPRIVKKVQQKFDEACQEVGYSRSVNTLWVRLALVIYGKKAVKKLCEFVVDHQINDLHEGNLGYKNDRPILLDFSGYYR